MITRVLIIEDEESIGFAIKEYLSGNNFMCEQVKSVKDALDTLEDKSFDCLLIDIGLPDGSGIDIIKHVRKEKKDFGIIVISAREQIDTRVEALMVGADDFLLKPFHLAELSARVAALMRRKKNSIDDIIRFEEITIHTDKNLALVKGEEVVLTRKEFDLLVYFVSNNGRLVTKEALSYNIWRNLSDLDVSNDIIYTHIKNLRKKLVEAGAKDYIKSVYGIGYKWSS